MKILKINLFMLFLFGLPRLNSMDENLIINYTDFNYMNKRRKIKFLKQLYNDLRDKNKTNEEIVKNLKRAEIFAIDVNVQIGSNQNFKNTILLFEKPEFYSKQINMIRNHYHNHDENIYYDRYLQSFIINGNEFYRICFDPQF